MDYYQTQAMFQWDMAHGRAQRLKWIASLRRKNIELPDFNRVTNSLHLHTAIYRGIHVIQLEKIIGSVGRFHDFVDGFLPVSSELSSRWQSLAALTINPSSGGLPPIDVFKVGEVYFVSDGNHRVSVANQLDIPDIEARVWEYEVAQHVTALERGVCINGEQSFRVMCVN
ncbi:MAG: ParB N-terminal domain-containing protein [Burkholderiales bacterium]|nr:ParB N-terminal domain-containing protein [Anaerolineae bacterium]